MKTLEFSTASIAAAVWIAMQIFSISACMAEPLAGVRDQTPIDSGAFAIDQARIEEMVGEIQTLCVSHGLEELRNTDTERQVGRRDRRSVFDVTCHKKSSTGLWFTNVISSNSVTFQLYGEPFSKGEYVAFQQSFIELIAKYIRDGGEIHYSMRDGAKVKQRKRSGVHLKSLG